MTSAGGRGLAEGNDRVNVVNATLRTIGVGCFCIAMLVGLGAGAASAEPTGDGQASCVYTLSKPFVVDVSGVKMVSATLKSLPCAGHILPNSQTVCVEPQGGGTAPQCVNKGGYELAQVYFAPYRPGTTYISTGTGCGSVGPTMVSACATQGPYTAKL